MSVGGSQETPADATVSRRQVISWALWDWSTQPWNSVILTFVFANLYLVSKSFLPPEIAAQAVDDCTAAQNIGTPYCLALSELSSGYGEVTVVAGFLVLLLAPVLGQRADADGRKKSWVLGATALLVGVQFALFFVYADPRFFWYGAILLALGAVISEIAGVNYNAMLVQVSTPKTVGRVSGLGWGLGYIGGIVALAVVVVLTELDWFGLDNTAGLRYRLIAVGCAVWTIVFAIPFVRHAPEASARADRPKVGFFASYVVLAKDIGKLYRTSRSAFWFLLASGVYRDGLAGVFAFGGILAAAGFGFSDTEVILFGIAANLIAGVATILAGRLDDRFGPRAVIVTALSIMIVAALLVFFGRGGGKLVFWICGLVLSSCVGPTQAASRGLLARVTPAGMQGEVFGLYATTGRVASPLSPIMWTLFTVTLAGIAGIAGGVLGLTIVLALGLALLLLVKLPSFAQG